jgi:hypothetical protein
MGVVRDMAIPNELLSHIASYLDKEDFASMRLVNKKMSNALQHVFIVSIVEKEPNHLSKV